jgi:hypothetical protein
MIQVRGRNVNVSSGCVHRFSTWWVLRLFTIGHNNNLNCAFYSPIMAVE